VITLSNEIPDTPILFSSSKNSNPVITQKSDSKANAKQSKFKGRVWVIDQDNIDTDMIFHNRYLTITDINEMGQYAFDNLSGYEDFSKKVKPGDIVVTGKNFGAGSSRQQAVDCFESLGVTMIIAESFGAIYERNAINKGYPIVRADLVSTGLETNQEIEVDLETGNIMLPSGNEIQGEFSEVQMNIYRKAGLLNK
jgi:3-isopropylmalate dehydratase small subunit